MTSDQTRHGQRACDRAWRSPVDAKPPLPSFAPLAFWAAMAVVLTGIVVFAVGGPGPLDDPHQGDQRPGFLLGGGEAHRLDRLRLPGDPIGKRPVVVVFDRQAPDPDDLQGFVAEAPGRAAVFLVLPGSAARSRFDGRVEVSADPAGAIARALGMPEPKDGGPPVGYALVDSHARVRYATLDPMYLGHGFELDVVGGAVK